MHERDLAAVAVAAPLTEGHEGQADPLTGPASLTQVERVRLLEEVVGRTLRLEEMEPTEAQAYMVATMPPPVVESVLEMVAAQVGRTAQVLDTMERAAGRAPYAYSPRARMHAADFA